MRLIDLSQPLYHDCPNCPVHPPIKSEMPIRHETHGWNMEIIHFSIHSGSHLDAPMHKVKNGKSVDQIPLESFVGEAFIADLRDSKPDRPITGELLQKRLSAPVRNKIVLLATGWGDKRAKTDEWLHHSPHLTPDGARWLVSNGARAVGIDHYSIAGLNEPNNSETHQLLLEAELWIVEELHFPVEVFSLPQPVQFWSLPINFKGHSGAFCRPVILAP